MKVAVGQDIESICGKCGDVWHVVFAMVGDKVAKVQCKQCGNYHRHRPPGGSAPEPKSSSGQRSNSGSPKAAPTPRRTRGPEIVPKIAPNLDKAPQEYSIKTTFAPGDRIIHPSFGEGLVEEIAGVGKISVYFPGERRLLAHGRG